MIVLRILKILFFGIVGQIFIWSLLTLIFSPRVGGNMYWVWVMGAEWLFPPAPAATPSPAEQCSAS